MVKISEIRESRSSVSIVLDNGAQYWLRHEDLSDSGYCVGTALDPVTFMEQIRIFQYPRALNTAIAMLARRPCSRGEIVSRLQYRRFSEDVIDLVIYKLEKESLVDDSAFCDLWIRSRLSRGYGPARIRQELRSKQVPPDLIESALAKADNDLENKKAIEAALKAWSRIKPGENTGKARQKVIASLVRKGFDWETARKACLDAQQRMNE